MKTASKRSHKFSGPFIVFLILAASLACSISYTPKTQIQPTIVEEQTYKSDCVTGIFPGKTSKQEVIAILGEPLRIEQDALIETLIYYSPINGLFNEIILQNETVSLVSVILGEDNLLTWSSVKTQYGDPAYTSFSTFLQGCRFYIFPEQGISFTADEEQDIVFIQECFVPMQLENYINNYGGSLLMEDPFIR